MSEHAMSEHCPSPDICYRLHIPEHTAALGDGNIYFQITASVTYSWIGLGQGSRMAGANIFVIYADGQGNVTVSPRLGIGHMQPEYDTTADITLLEGSGVDGYQMLANVLCRNCSAWLGGSMDFTSNSATWIWASRAGMPLVSDNVHENILVHQQQGVFEWDFTAAKGGQDVNPFLSLNSSNITDGFGGGGYNTKKVWHQNDSIPLAHAIMASFAFLVLFPTGAIVIRVSESRRLVRVHATIQIVAYTILFAAMGLGIHMGITGQLFHNKHPYVGMAIMIILFSQAVDGLLHHAQFKKYQRRTFLTYLHMWTGRVVIVLGMIQGGLGMQLAGVTSPGKIVPYSIVAGLSATAYVTAIIFDRRKARQVRRLEDNDGGKDLQGHTELTEVN